MDIKEISKDKRVLVLEGYCKQTLPFFFFFSEVGCELTVL